MSNDFQACKQCGEQVHWLEPWLYRCLHCGLQGLDQKKMDEEQASILFQMAQNLDQRVLRIEKLLPRVMEEKDPIEKEIEFKKRLVDFVFSGLCFRFGNQEFDVSDVVLLLNGAGFFAGKNSIAATEAFSMVAYHYLATWKQQGKIIVSKGKPSNPNKPWLGGFLMKIKEPVENPSV